MAADDSSRYDSISSILAILSLSIMPVSPLISPLHRITKQRLFAYDYTIIKCGASCQARTGRGCVNPFEESPLKEYHLERQTKGGLLDEK
jgi:hypothetical protein